MRRNRLGSFDPDSRCRQKACSADRSMSAGVTVARIRWPSRSSGTPSTRHERTVGNSSKTASTSSGLTLVPPTLTQLASRPTITRPSGVQRPISPTTKPFATGAASTRSGYRYPDIAVGEWTTTSPDCTSVASPADDCGCWASSRGRRWTRTPGSGRPSERASCQPAGGRTQIGPVSVVPYTSPSRPPSTVPTSSAVRGSSGMPAVR
jgi:hypothetical protein